MKITRKVTFKNYLFTATAGAVLMAAAPALAQTAPPADQAATVEEVVVTGFRASLANAINLKRNAAGVVDVIKAEDIADFPDANLAESIQRVPGVSISRDAGEGRSITVRGLGASFTRVRINGMEAQSTTGGTDSSGGANRGRGFDFNTFASELFNSITVRKTQAAEVQEGSLGATVDLQTSRPFDYKGFNLALSAQQGYNDLRGKWDPRLAGLVSNTWDTPVGRFGALISAAYTRRHMYEDGFGTVGWDLVSTNGGFCSPIGVTPANPPVSAATGTSATACGTAAGISVPRAAGTAENIAAYTTASGANVHMPRLPRYGRLTHDQKRTGVTASLQWEPSPDTTLTLDGLYSKFDAKREEDWLENFGFSRALSNLGKPLNSVRSAVVSPTGDLVYGAFDGVRIRSEMRYDELTTEFKQFVLTGKHRFNDRFRIEGLVGHSTSEFANPIQTTIMLDRLNSDGYSYDLRQNDRLPTINYGFDTTNPNNFTFINNVSEIRMAPQWVKNTFDTANLNGGFDLTDGLTLKAGVEYRKYEFDTRSTGRLNSQLLPALPPGKTLADLTKLVTGFGKNLGQPGTNITSWVVPDIDKFSEALGIYSNTGLFELTGVTNSSARGNIRGVEEVSKAAWTQLDFRTEALPFPVRGDIGVRYVKTKQSSRGYQLLGAAPVQVTAEREYDDILPSLNVTAEVTPELLLRFAASKVIARPELGNLTPGGSITVTGARSISAGNPDLDPIRAKTLDGAVEWYFAKDSLLSVGVFYKDIKTYIQSLQEDRPFNTSGLPLDLLANSQTAPTDIFTFRTPANTKGGPLKGFEINYQQAFTFLPDVLPFLPRWTEHFGTLLNYTYVDSKIDYFLSATGGSSTSADLVGLSKNAFNATLYYEDSRFSARVSAAYRDKYLTSVPGGNTGNDVNGTNELLTVDASASFAVTKKLKLTFEGLNLTDEFVDQYQDSARNSAFVYTHTGRQFNVGLQYKF
ncbi:TonB-dependent receptor [Caulobacter segnis]